MAPNASPTAPGTHRTGSWVGQIQYAHFGAQKNLVLKP